MIDAITGLTEKKRKARSACWLGTNFWRLKIAQARQGRNPQTVLTIRLKAAKVPVVQKAGKALKDSVFKNLN